MSSIKLIPASGGGSVSLVPPNSTSGSDVTITLPTASQTLPISPVMDQFFHPCNGATVACNCATNSGNVVLQDVTEGLYGTTTYVDLPGSTIAYTPPTGTKTVIYKFWFQHSKSGDSHQIGHFKFFIDSDEVTKAYLTHGAQALQGPLIFEWPITISNSADTTIGKVNGWTSAKTLKMQYREYGSGNETKVHETENIDGGGDNAFVMPRIGITAIQF